MKAFLLLCSLVFSIASHAQESIKGEMPVAAPASSGYLKQGVRVAYVKPFLDIIYRDKMYEFSNTEKIDRVDGVSVGWAYLPLRALGFTTNFALLGMKEVTQENLLRLDVNVGYAWTRYLNTKAGLNLSNFVDKEMRDFVKPGVGYQASVGTQFTRNFGADIAYVEMKQIGRNWQMFTVRERGMELSLNATF